MRSKFWLVACSRCDRLLLADNEQDRAGVIIMYDTTCSTDFNLRTAVLQKLKTSVPGIPELSIQADDGVITVSGQFKDSSQLFEAGSQIWGVAGVRAVIEATSGDTPSTLTAQRMLAKGVLSELSKRAVEDTSVVRVTVRNGYVILDGLVRYQSEREQIGKCIRNVPGVLGICNRIHLEAEISRFGSSTTFTSRSARNGSPTHNGQGERVLASSELILANHG